MRTIYIRLTAALTVALVMAATASYAQAACYWWMFCECIPDWLCW